MKYANRCGQIGLLLVSTLSVAAAGAFQEIPPADAVVLHGKVYTVNTQQPWAQAVAIRAGKIIAVGTDEQIEALRGPSTQVLDAANRMVLPGMIDDHYHFALEPWRSTFFELFATSVDELKKKLKEHLDSHPQERVLVAWAALTAGATQVSKKDLDSIARDRPIIVNDGHDLWFNSKALEIAGITRKTPDPRAGTIVHDPKTGDTTGKLREFAGRDAFYKVAPQISIEVKRQAYLNAVRVASSVGLTRIVSAGYDVQDIDVFDGLRRDGLLTTKLAIATVAVPPRLLPEEIDTVDRLRRKYHDSWIDASAIKFYEDGLVESGAGAMVEPYVDQTGMTNPRGDTAWEPQELTAAIVEVNRRGFNILVHATGDRAVREALDAYESAVRANGPTTAVKRIEHAEHVTDVDLPRFAKLGVFVSMQPAFASEEVWNAQTRRLGPDRVRLQFPWASLENAGACLIFDTDFPAYTTSPWDEIQVSLTSPFQPQQRVTVAQAIQAYTLNAARGAGVEKTEGSLEVGKSGDLIVLSQNLFDVDPHTVAQTKVMLTIVGGKVVYQAQ